VGEPVGDQLSDVVIGERIEDMFAIAPRNNNPFGSQKLEPLRNRRQVILQSLGQLSDAHLTLGQQGQQAQTTLIPESSENGGRSKEGFRIGDRKVGRKPTMIFTEAFSIPRWLHVSCWLHIPTPHGSPSKLPNLINQPIN
jgi:hypothetical protein